MNTTVSGAFSILLCLALILIPASAGSLPDQSASTGTGLQAARQLAETTSPDLYRITTSSPATGSLVLDSVPSGAALTIDGVSRGTTPFTLRTLPAGDHVVVLKMSGFNDYTKTMTITGGGIVRETWTLIPITTPTTAAPVRRELVTTTQTLDLQRITTIPPGRREAVTTTLTWRPDGDRRIPAVTTTTPAPVIGIVTQIPAVNMTKVNEYASNLCHYDPSTATCIGTCPLTGRKCQVIKQDGCSGSSVASVKCGCVDTTSLASMESAGLVTAKQYQLEQFGEPKSPKPGVAESITGFVSDLVHPVTDLSSEDPNAYTMDTTFYGNLLRPDIYCAGPAFRTVLKIKDPSTGYIDSTTGSQKAHFVWDSADPRIGSVVWQASVLPFPPSSSNLTEVPGLIAQGNLLATQHQFTIDFSDTVPTSSEMATVWSDRKSFVTMQKNALISVKSQMSYDQSLTGTGSVLPGNDAARAKFSLDLDNAISQSTLQAQNPQKYTLKPLSGKPITMPAASVADAKFAIASGVMAPVLGQPRMTKEGIASALPQVQRTLFIRVVPFDTDGNATGYPSNTEQVIVGEPVYDTTGPWSGWQEVTAVDQSGFPNPPEVVSFNGKTYFFNVRGDHHIAVMSVDAQGKSTGWSDVPGSFLTDKPAIAVQRTSRITGDTSGKMDSHLFLFASTMDAGAANGVWYTRMDSSGAWDGWKPIPQKNAKYRYTVERAMVIDNEIYVFSDFFYRKYHPEDETYTIPASIYAYQHLSGPEYLNNNLIGTWGADWMQTSTAASDSTQIIGGGQLSQVGEGCFVDGRSLGSNQSRMNVYSLPVAKKICDSCNPEISVKLLKQVDVPGTIAGSGVSLKDMTAIVAHGRLYLFLRSSNGHIYSNWMTLVTNPASAEPLGSLHEWEDISPGSVAQSPGLRSAISWDGSRVDLFAIDVKIPSSADSGSAFSFLTIGQSPALYRNSYNTATDTPQIIVSNSGNKQSKENGLNTPGLAFITTMYNERDLNLSWSRTDPFWFAWNSSRNDLTSAEWQVSVLPFDEVKPSVNQIGIIASGPLNLNATDPEYKTQGTDFSFPSYVDRAHLFPMDFKSFAAPADPANPGVTPYYFRFVGITPTDTPGRYRAYVSRQTEVDWGPQDQVKPIFCKAPTVYTYNYQMPKIRIIGFTPTQKQDPNYQCYGVVTTGWDYYRDKCLKDNKGKTNLPDPSDPLNPSPAMLSLSAYCNKYGHIYGGNSATGDSVNLCPPKSDKAWYEELWDTFKDYVDLLKSIVDSVAQAYNDLKSQVASLVCGDDPTCNMIVESGINIGMAALGVPPTIPNFDELMDKGIGYLAASVAEETGVPGSDIAVEQALKAAAEEMKHKPSAKDSRGIQLDPKYQYKPATLIIELRNDDPNNRTAPGSFRIRDSWNLYRTEEPDVPYPGVEPGGKTIVFPVVLQEDQWKGISCTSGFEGSEVQESGSCYDIYAGHINEGWWERYKASWGKGGGFSLEYTGLTQNFTENITAVMSAKYGVPLTTYKYKNPLDLSAPDCMQEKNLLEFVAYNNAMKVTYHGWDENPSFAVPSYGRTCGQV